MSDELKPCPFCGSKAVNDILNGIYCSNKNCYQYKHLDPISTWQSRPIEDALRAQLETANNENANLHLKLDVAIEALKKNANSIVNMRDYPNNTSVGNDAMFALARIDEIGKEQQ